MQHNRRLRAGEGVFYFLGGVLLKTDDTHVHFMYTRRPRWPTTFSRSTTSRASAGLMQCTIEHYENLDDLKRVVSRTELI